MRHTPGVTAGGRASERAQRGRWSRSAQRVASAAAAGRGWSKGAATGEVRRGSRSLPGAPSRASGVTAPVVEQRAPASGVETTTSQGSRKLSKYFSTVPGICRIPGPGLSVVDARIPCMATVFDEPERTRSRPRSPPSTPTSTSSPTSGSGPCRATEIADTLPPWHRAAAPGHRARAPGRPPGRPPRPRRRTRRRRHRQLLGQHRPGRPNATPNAASRSRTPWTTTTSRSGTRWPPASVSEEQAAVIVKGVDALPVEHRRDAEAHLIGLRGRARPGRAAPARAPRPRSGRPRDRRSTTSSRPCNARKRSPRRPAGSPSPTTGTACATAGSPCRPRSARCSSRRCSRSTRPKHRQHSGTPKGLGHAFCEYVTRYPVDRLPQAGGVDATDRGHHDPGEPARGQPDPGAVGHRGPDHRRPGPQAGLRGRDHPDGARREVQDPRPRTQEAALRPVPADRDPAPRPALHQPTAATGPPRCATSTTTSPGAAAARPTSPTDACCARGTTPTPTTRSTR